MFHFRLKPSTIPGAGVGVFATAEIPRGTALPELFAEDDVVRHPRAGFEALDLPADVKDHFATWYDDECFTPRCFNRMSVGWYLNHAADPNLVRDAHYVYHAVRDIAAGEELFIDYGDL